MTYNDIFAWAILGLGLLAFHPITWDAWRRRE